jgi:large subunit ribosomal protein L6
MSRIGKKPVPIEGGATVKLAGRTVTVTGKNGTLSYDHRPEVTVRVDDDAKEVVIERENDSRNAKAMHGLTRSLIANMIQGVSTGYTKELEIVGVGWNAALKGRTVELNVGYADTRKVNVPDGVTVDVKSPNITITGADKQLVGQVAAQIRSHRKPEPYNGKGIKYRDETIIRKQGKAFAGGG